MFCANGNGPANRWSVHCRAHSMSTWRCTQYLPCGLCGQIVQQMSAALVHCYCPSWWMSCPSPFARRQRYNCYTLPAYASAIVYRRQQTNLLDAHWVQRHDRKQRNGGLIWFNLQCRLLPRLRSRVWYAPPPGWSPHWLLISATLTEYLNLTGNFGTRILEDASKVENNAKTLRSS